MLYKKEIAAFPSYLQWWYCFTSIFVDGEFLDGILSPPTVPLHLPTTDISVPDHFGSLSYQKLEIVIYIKFTFKLVRTTRWLLQL